MSLLIEWVYTLVRMAAIKKSTNDKCWRGCREKGTPPTLLVGMQTSTATTENSVWRLLKKLETEPTSVQFSHSVMSDSLQPHEPQHARPPCPSPTPGVHPNPCPLCRWWFGFGFFVCSETLTCHLTWVSISFFTKGEKYLYSNIYTDGCYVDIRNGML